MKQNRSSQLKARISCVVLRVTTRRIWLHVLMKKWTQGWFYMLQTQSRRVPQDSASYSRHRCPCSGNSIRRNSSGAAGTTSRSLGCNGYWLSFSLHSCTWDIKQPGVGNVQSSTSISCLYRVRYCVLLRREARRLHSQFGRTSQPSQIPSYSL